MRVLTNKDNRRFLLAMAGLMAFFCLGIQLLQWFRYKELSLPLFALSLLAAAGALAVCFCYFLKQRLRLEEAVYQINRYLSGDKSARIACDQEGELYKLFHSVNTLAAVLNAHAENEIQTKEFLRETISAISHQLKTPLAALNIYNGLLQDEAAAFPSMKELAALSERELDRMETLVQSLLKIARLDAGALVMEKRWENLGDMLKDIELHFAYRARREKKELILSGDEATLLFCDRDWVMEAVGNIVKNALDHTAAGDRIALEWKRVADRIRLTVRDSGKGIHPEDIHHIFKRFYRSRFSQDTQGIGLGLPLAKAVVEAHEGSVSVDSVWGEGSVFVISFPNPTKL